MTARITSPPPLLSPEEILELIEGMIESELEQLKGIRAMGDGNSCASGMCLGALDVLKELRAQIRGEQ